MNLASYFTRPSGKFFSWIFAFVYYIDVKIFSMFALFKIGIDSSMLIIL